MRCKLSPGLTAVSTLFVAVLFMTEALAIATVYGIHRNRSLFGRQNIRI